MSPIALGALLLLAGQAADARKCSVVLTSEASPAANELRALLQASVVEIVGCRAPLAETQQGDLQAARDMGLSCDADDVQCLRKLAAILDVHVVVAAEVGADGRELRLVAVDANSGARLNEMSATLEPSGPTRLAKVRETVGLLLEPERVLVSLRVVVEPAGAEVLVDGASVGVAPIESAVTLKPGVHVVEARLGGHEPAREEVDVAAGGQAIVELSLSPIAGAGPDPLLLWGGVASGFSALALLAGAGTLAIEGVLSLSPETGSGQDRSNLQTAERALLAVTVVGVVGAAVAGGVAATTLLVE
jgi:hypothetical protein